MEYLAQAECKEVWDGNIAFGKKNLVTLFNAFRSFIWLRSQELPPSHEAVPHPTHWMPPPPSFYKVNYDGATFQDSVSAGLGVVVRDFNGGVIAALLERITLPPTVEDLEALACRKAVSFTSDLDLQDVVFEGDSEVIFKHAPLF